MADDLVSVVLAAGAGTRLRPLTTFLPKALCPINNVPLVDLALARAGRVTPDVAVNVHHWRELMETHLAGRAHVSVEDHEALGTAGALGNLREWIAGRDVLVINADAWHNEDLTAFVEDWDRERIRLLCVDDAARGDFGSLRLAGAALMPWDDVATLEPVPSGLYEVSWQRAEREGRLDLVVSETPFFDCGTIPEYHAANMAASGGHNVIGSGAVVEGSIERTVLWPDVHVWSNERLVGAIRPKDGVTLVAEPAGVGDAV
ncbi:MAG: sugar phosphate nucleotidyltransferase [Actinomycetota bacterium]